jgi:hypothetical protein
MTFHRLGISSSQLTKSYFSEGKVYHQPDMDSIWILCGLILWISIDLLIGCWCFSEIMVVFFGRRRQQDLLNVNPTFNNHDAMWILNMWTSSATSDVKISNSQISRTLVC